MRNQFFRKLFLLFLIRYVRGNPGGLRAPLADADEAPFLRELETSSNETEVGDASEWFGDGDGNPVVNETGTLPTTPAEEAATEAPEVATEAPVVATEAPELATNAPDNLDTSSTSSVTTDPPAEKTESPTDGTAPTTPPEDEVPTGDDQVGDDQAEDDEFADDQVGDDEFPDGDDDSEQGEEQGWGEYEPEEDTRTKAPYVAPTGDDPFAKPPDESEWAGQDWKQETTEEMMHDKNVIIAVSSAVLFGFVLALCSAQQVIENPDGCCAR